MSSRKSIYSDLFVCRKTGCTRSHQKIPLDQVQLISHPIYQYTCQCNNRLRVCVDCKMYFTFSHWSEIFSHTCNNLSHTSNSHSPTNRSTLTSQISSSTNAQYIRTNSNKRKLINSATTVKHSTVDIHSDPTPIDISNNISSCSQRFFSMESKMEGTGIIDIVYRSLQTLQEITLEESQFHFRLTYNSIVIHIIK